MRKGKTLLLVTHHIHEIPPEVERVVLLKQEKIREDGEKRAILTESNLSQLFDCQGIIGSSQWLVSSPSRTQHTALIALILRPAPHEMSGPHRLVEL